MKRLFLLPACISQLSTLYCSETVCTQHATGRQEESRQRLAEKKQRLCCDCRTAIAPNQTSCCSRFEPVCLSALLPWRN